MIIIEVNCDNCGAKYYTTNKDVNKEKFWHRVCDTCYMPMKVKNPFYKETKHDTNQG